MYEATDKLQQKPKADDTDSWWKILHFPTRDQAIAHFKREYRIKVYHCSIPQEIQSHRKAILDLITCVHANLLRKAATELKADYEIIWQAVSRNGKLLRLAAPPLQNDPTIVLAAVSNDGTAL